MKAQLLKRYGGIDDEDDEEDEVKKLATTTTLVNETIVSASKNVTSYSAAALGQGQPGDFPFLLLALATLFCIRKFSTLNLFF
jgi:hypothetical protein